MEKLRTFFIRVPERRNRKSAAFYPNVAPGGAMIVPGWAFSGGFSSSPMAQAIGEEGNPG
jgi:hypothetical protein